MDELTRTAEHFARVAERRRALRATFESVLGARNEFVWEIGCGHGHFLTAYAVAHPDRLCIGIDIEADRIERAIRKRDRAELPDLHFIRADARDFLAALPDPARFAAIYALFPDPWPKKRHHKHRLFQPDFISQIAARTTPGARLYFRTDHGPYFSETRAAFASSDAWEIVDEAWAFEAPTVFQQHALSYDSLVAVRRVGG
jgi:tRNA (guanine-N7-)-methyltransferase